MMNVKVKSVFKTICYVSVFVIFCYIEGKYNLIFKDGQKAEMAGLRILSAEFEVFGVVQGELWKVFKVLTLSINKEIRENFFLFFRRFLPKGKFDGFMNEKELNSL